jgi:hypothetical protein
MKERHVTVERAEKIREVGEKIFFESNLEI